MYIIIAGCQKVGATLASTLSEENHDVVVIDSDPANFEPLGSGFNGVTIAGMPIDEDILRGAGIERTDALAAVTNDDNMNVMVSQIARELFNVPKVITRIYDPERETVFHQMGLNTVCPTTLVADRIRELLLPGYRHPVLDFHGTSVAFNNVRASRRYIGKSVGAIRDEHAIGLIRDGKFIFARPELTVDAGDTLIFAEYAG